MRLRSSHGQRTADLVGRKQLLQRSCKRRVAWKRHGREGERARERERERERERKRRAGRRARAGQRLGAEQRTRPLPVMTHRLFKPRVRQLQKRPTSAQYLARDACLGIQPSAAQSTKHLQPTPRLDPTQPSLWPVAPSVSGTTHGPSARYTDPSIGDKNSVMLVARGHRAIRDGPPSRTESRVRGNSVQASR